jgi:hypothetical protein
MIQPQHTGLENDMIDEANNQEIEVSVLLLGLGYAVTFVTLILWFAGQVGY